MKSICLIVFCCSCLTSMGDNLGDESIRERLDKRKSDMALALHEMQFVKTIRIVSNLNHDSGNNLEIDSGMVSKLNQDGSNYLLDYGFKDHTNLDSLVTFAFMDGYSAFYPSLGKVYQYDASKLLSSFFDSLAGVTNNNMRYIKAFMVVGSLVGFHTTSDVKGTGGSAYVGPFWLCVMDMNAHVTTDPRGVPNRPSEAILYDFPRDLLLCLINKKSKFISSFPKGRYTKKQGGLTIIVDYEVEIIWKNAIPSEVKIKFDLSPMKDRLFRVTENKTQD